ncbi:C2H2 transcription factor [Metarhizium robertsii ARSEF 23]|uniref:C2H2 transcription factor n=1 Tax=Metarhizium robertsii (strain ARSEF 23 / ATCC MYA-3075) TaxID=655844 RepID=A0A0B2XFX4_METRA|nr:C2H2 transcription factor [Metarhizium robertsii ARSEF 23]KHO10841.1 C2H2 transcription factor [Metarhizium robertsii ARSEF 23]
MRHEKKDHERCQNCAVEYLSSDRNHHQRNCSGQSNRVPTHSAPFDKAVLDVGSDSSAEDIIRQYQHRAISALEEFKAIVNDICSAAEEGTREKEDYEEYRRNVLHGATVGKPITAVGKPITAEQYLGQYSESAYSHPTDNFVICSWEEARTILGRGPLKLPLLIPRDLNHSVGDRLRLEEYVKYLKTRQQLDVHIYRKPAAEGRIPKRLDSDKAVELFLKESNGPVNLLGLDGYQPNPVHPSISGLHYFIDLSAIDVGASGSREGLNKTATFQLLGSLGAISTPHNDLYGVLTSQ